METYRSVQISPNKIILIRGRRDAKGKRQRPLYFAMPLNAENAEVAMQWAKKIRILRPKMSTPVVGKEISFLDCCGWLSTNDGKLDEGFSLRNTLNDLAKPDRSSGMALNAKDMMRFSMLLLTRQHEKIAAFLLQKRPNLVPDEPSDAKIKNGNYDIPDWSHRSNWGINWDYNWDKLAAQFVTKFYDEKFVFEYEETFYIGDSPLEELLWFCENHKKIDNHLWYKWWAWPIIDAYRMIGHQGFGENLAEETWEKYNTYCH